MSALDTDMAFAAMMARVARAQSINAGSFEHAEIRNAVLSPPQSGNRIYTICIIGALVALSAVMIFSGCSALWSEDPTIWIHRLMAISLAQTILFAAMMLKIAPLATAGRQTTKILVAEPPPMIEQMQERAPPPLPLPLPIAPERPVLVGHGLLAGRDYAEYSDGSVEIETMLGRRRFITLETARTFVGA